MCFRGNQMGIGSLRVYMRTLWDSPLCSGTATGSGWALQIPYGSHTKIGNVAMLFTLKTRSLSALLWCT